MLGVIKQSRLMPINWSNSIGRTVIAVATLCSACAPHTVRPTVTTSVVRVHGSVFDSLMLAPLRGARVTLAAAETITIVTDSNGRFDAALRPGTWRAEVALSRLDSLGLRYPVHSLVITSKANESTEVWTPSRRVAIQMLCGDSARRDDAVVVGLVRDAITHRAVDSATMIIRWVNLTLQGGRFIRSNATLLTQTAHNGWYVACGVPANGSLVAWVEHGGSASGIVPLSLEGMPTRVDFSLDPTTRVSESAAPIGADLSDDHPLPTTTGVARYRVLVQDMNGRPVPNARVSVLGQHTTRTTNAGNATLDSIAGGTQTLEILAIGYQPQRRVVEIVPNREPVDTFQLVSMRTLLDTIRVTAGRDPTGFDRRRTSARGQFITAADVEREDPTRTTELLRTRDGLRYRFGMNGVPDIEMTTQYAPCKPMILLDGFPARSLSRAPGSAAMDWLVHPDEIGGVEIYTQSANIPPELARWGRGCGAIAFWTREALGLPKLIPPKP